MLSCECPASRVRTVQSQPRERLQSAPKLRRFHSGEPCYTFAAQLGSRYQRRGCRTYSSGLASMPLQAPLSGPGQAAFPDRRLHPVVGAGLGMVGPLPLAPVSPRWVEPERWPAPFGGSDGSPFAIHFAGHRGLSCRQASLPLKPTRWEGSPSCWRGTHLSSPLR